MNPNSFRALCAIYLTILMAAVAGPIYYMWPELPALRETTHRLLFCRGNPNCFSSEEMAIGGSIRAASGEVAIAAKTFPLIAASIKNMTDNSALSSRRIVDLSEKAVIAVGHADDAIVELKSTLVEFHGLVADLHTSIQSILADTDVLLKSSDVSMQAAGESLKKLGLLEDDLKTQIDAGSPEFLATLKAMHDVIADPAILETLKHINDGTASIASTAETMDIATKGLRDKVGRVKYILEKIFGMLKVTLSAY